MECFIMINVDGLPSIVVRGDTTPVLFENRDKAENFALSHDACQSLGYEIYEWDM